MKNSGFFIPPMSPCLRIFIEALLDEAGGEFFIDQLFVSDEGVAMGAGLTSGLPLTSDENYN